MVINFKKAKVSLGKKANAKIPHSWLIMLKNDLPNYDIDNQELLFIGGG